MDHKTEELLRQMARSIDEPVSDDLAGRIKRQIPQTFQHRKWGKGPINIIVHFRISRLAAAAAIIITLMACTIIYQGQNQNSDGIYDDLKMLVTFLPDRGGSTEQVMAGFQNFSLALRDKGKNVVFYGDVIEKPSPNTLLMYWKLKSGDYRVVFGDFRVDQLTATELIETQSHMLLAINSL